MLVGLGAAVFTLSCLGLAMGSSHKPAERGTDVTFTSQTRFNNGDMLPAGTYRMEVPENSPTPNVKFTQYGQVKATVRAKIVPQQKKNDQTEVVATTRGKSQVVTQIRPGGWEESLDFAQGAHHASGT